MRAICTRPQLHKGRLRFGPMSRAGNNPPTDPGATLYLFHGKPCISKNLNPLSATNRRLGPQRTKTLGPKQLRCKLEGFGVAKPRAHSWYVASILFRQAKLLEMLGTHQYRNPSQCKPLTQISETQRRKGE